MSKVGFIVECGPEGIDVKVVTKVCQLLTAEHKIAIEPQFATMSNKDNLIKDSGSTADGLLKTGCERVVVMWDERPPWGEPGQKLCLVKERDEIIVNLNTAKVPLDKVGLVAVRGEIEAWLLADHVLLTAVLSRKTHKVKVAQQKQPERIKNPKGAMIGLFENAGHGRYNDLQHAGTIVKHLTSLARLRKCKSFQRFEKRVRGI